MSDILFCNTDGWEFRRDCLDLTKNYQCSAILRLKPDIMGLRGWDNFRHIDLSKYGLIYVHLNPAMVWPPWFSFPRLIRKRAPDSIMVVSHEYPDKYFQKNSPYLPDETIPPLINQYFKYGDYFVTPSRSSYKIWSDHLDIPVIHAHIGQPIVDESEWPRPLSWKSRRGIFVMEHTIQTPIVRKFEVVKNCGYSMTAITACPIRTGENLKTLADAVGVRYVRCFSRLPWKDYMNEIRKCRLALELDYVGIHRMAYECAKVGVPVVGTEYEEYRKILYPDLTINSTTEAIAMIESIYEDEGIAVCLNRTAGEVIREYWSQDACRERLFDFFGEIGYEGQT